MNDHATTGVDQRMESRIPVAAGYFQLVVSVALLAAGVGAYLQIQSLNDEVQLLRSEVAALHAQTDALTDVLIQRARARSSVKRRAAPDPVAQ